MARKRQPNPFEFKMPATQDRGALGLGLGLGARGREQFRQASAGGQLGDWLVMHPHAQAAFANAVNNQGQMGNIAGSFVNQNNLASQGQFGVPAGIGTVLNPATNPPPPSYPASQPPPQPGMPGSANYQPPGGQAPGDFQAMRDKLLQQYQTPMSDIYQAYMNSFQQGGGPLNIPSFQEMYGSYRDVADKEAQRRAAMLNEQFGAQGARYGSDILNAQGNLQRDVANDLRYQSGQFLTGLRNQQYQELQPIAQAQNQMSADAFARMMQQYQLQTAPPPLFAGQPPQFAQPTTIAY